MLSLLRRLLARCTKKPKARITGRSHVDVHFLRICPSAAQFYAPNRHKFPLLPNGFTDTSLAQNMQESAGTGLKSGSTQAEPFC
jgi:hypothetical protein